MVCPGFAVDCLETLEEIAMENRQRFMQAGGRKFEYVPALNASAGHVRFLADLIGQHTQGWVDAGFDVRPARKPRGTAA